MRDESQKPLTDSSDKNLKIGILASDLSHRHGWAHYCLSLIQALHRAGVRLTVVTPHNSADIEGLVQHKLLPSITPAERFLLPKQVVLMPRVREVLRDCDVIHAAIEPFASLASWVVGERPLFITGHGTYVREWSKRPWPVSMIYRQAFLRARLVCVSSYTERVAKATLPQVQSMVVNNGVDVERFAALESARKVEKRGPTVLSVGAVKPRKGTLELVRAMAVVRRDLTDAQCVIIGSFNAGQQYAKQVRAAVQELSLENCVHILGHVPEAELMGWYRAADVFVVPAINEGGRFEGYGLIYLEAGAAGLAVIGTTENGGEDAIEDGVTGLLVPQSRVAEELPDAILRLLRDPELAARMGAAGREKAARQSWDHVAGQMLKLYHQSVAADSSADF
ncbi:MAG: glycosyltransferase family 4 protein [Anaerolineae bacterium]|nr:glycosyltransferase family 4 protein [Anaerolineae bacterium]